METLRIKCPSCGVILEVKNSRQESVKKITCPKCHKRLAVTFGDIPTPKPTSVYQPIGTLYEGTESFLLSEGSNPIPNVSGQLAEIKVVRLVDGSCKHVLRTLSEEQPINVNGQIQQQGDEIVLASGDEFEVEGHLFTFDRSGKPKADQMHAEPEKVEPTRKPFSVALIICLFALIGGCSLWLLWPHSHGEPQLVAEADDSVIVQQDTIQPEIKVTRQNPNVKSNDKTVTVVEDDDYALDIQATKGNVKAQYKLGMRWVTSNDCSQVLKGVRYLEAAARNGYTEAQYALGIVFYKGSPSCGINRNTELSFQYMRQAVSNGSAKAQRFIESHQEE